MKSNLKKRPEDAILTQPDPVEFRCKNCNYSGFNRTGMKPRGYCGVSTNSMWGSPCDKCIDGWLESDIGYRLCDCTDPDCERERGESHICRWDERRQKDDTESVHK